MITGETVRGVFPVKPLADVAEFLDSKRRPVKEAERTPGPYPYYGANGQQGTIDGYIFNEPLVLLAEDGGFFDAPERGIAYRICGKTWVNNHAHVLRPRPGMDGNFLCRVLENYDVNPFISGTTRSKLTKGQAEKIEIPFPPLDEQKRIAAILDQADALRRLRQKTLDCVNTFQQVHFYERFGDPFKNPYRWSITSIRDLASSTQYETSAKAANEGQFPILRMGNLTYSGDLDFCDLKYINIPQSDFHKYTIQDGDILFNRTNSPELVGKTVVYRGSSTYAFAGYLVRLRTNEKAIPEFISAYLNSTYGKTVLRGMCKSIIGMANINATELQNIPIPLVPLELQLQFQQEISAIGQLRQTLKLEIERVTELFSSLQQRAFRGELTGAQLSHEAQEAEYAHAAE